MKNNRHIDAFGGFLNTINPFCQRMIVCTFLITLGELIIIAFKLGFKIMSGENILPAVYIPIIQNIMIFVVMMLFFAFLFDFASRREDS